MALLAALTPHTPRPSLTPSFPVENLGLLPSPPHPAPEAGPSFSQALSAVIIQHPSGQIWPLRQLSPCGVHSSEIEQEQLFWNSRGSAPHPQGSLRPRQSVPWNHRQRLEHIMAARGTGGGSNQVQAASCSPSYRDRLALAREEPASGAV